MKPFILYVAMLLMGAPWAVAQGAFIPASRDPIPNQYIVVLKRGVAVSDAAPAAAGPSISAVASAMASANGGAVVRTYAHALSGFTVRMSGASARRLAQDARVAFVEQDARVSVIPLVTQPNATWGLDRIDQRDLPLDGNYSYDRTASEVNAYIIDTGIRASHTELGGRVVGGFTSVQDGQGTNDCHGHGTHVAGTVGSATYGVAKAVSYFAVRVLDCGGSGSFSGVVAGVDWVTANHMKPAVANMSLGGGISTALDTAVTNSIAAGVTYAIAAGNSAADACSFSPARVPNAITVAASERADNRASYSNFGTCVDIFAPGTGITSAWNTSDTATNTISGTSMATPHVAGVAALYLSANPQATPAAVRDALVQNGTAAKITDPRGAPNVLLYSRFVPSADAPPTASFTASCLGLTCSFDGRGSTDDKGIQAYSWAFGDGTAPASGATTSHTYASGGTLEVTLTVTDTAGQTDTETQSVTVTIPDFPPSSRFVFTCVGLGCSFDGSASSDERGIVSYDWAFGDGLGTIEKTPTTSHLYARPGTYRVSLKVTDTAGQTDTSFQDVPVGGPKLIGEDLRSNVGDVLPLDRFQVVAFFDGVENGQASLGIEVATPTEPATRWIWIQGLRKFNRVIETREYDLGGFAPTGRFEVAGAIPDGVIDGVAFGLFYRDGAGRFHVLHSSDPAGESRASFACMWPISMNDATFLARTPQITNAGGRDQARAAICGAELLPNGVYAIGSRQ